MDVIGIIIAIGVLIFVAHALAWLFSFTKIPDVLLLMIIGLLVGTAGYQLITPEFFGEAGFLFIIVALVMILFQGAIDLNARTLIRSWRETSLLSLVNFFLTVIGVAAALVILADVPPILALIIGAIVGDTAAAIVIPLTEKLGIGERAKSILFLESSLSDVLSIALTIGLIRAYELGIFSFEAIATDIAASFGIAVIIGGILACIWSLLLQQVRHVHDSIFLTPALVFVLFGTVELMGLSGLIAVIAFGITLGNIPLLRSRWEERHPILQVLLHPSGPSRRERAFFSEVVFVLQTIFFVYIGISMVLSEARILELAAILVGLMLIIRLIAVRLTIPSSIPGNDAANMAIMAPKGLATAVLASIPIQRGLEGGAFVQDLTFAVVFFSVVTTSVLIFLVNKTPVSHFYELLLGKTEAVDDTNA